MKKDKKILIAFYGDDFTGSTDALEFICRAGAKAILFIEPPTKEQLAAFHDLDAFGVAGKTRALTPAMIEEILIPAFEQIKSLGVRHVHYKTCSTFDSSPTIGSIGKAIDCGAAVFKNDLIPIMGGMPALGRYCSFGNLFARMGIGSNGEIYRLDRHPSMSKHPVTPAEESDLRLHLGTQTSKKIGLIDVLRLNRPITEWKNHLEDDEKLVLMDSLYEEELEKIGEWMENECAGNETLFSAGSSGVEMALGKYWNSQGILKPVTEWKDPGKASPMLVVSGSCSPVTAAQIEWAKKNGFEEVQLDLVKICNEGVVEETIMEKVITLVQQQNVIVHTGAKQTENFSSEKLGSVLGVIAKEAITTAAVKRIVFSGGDTSSHAARAMGIDAVEMIAPLVIGAPLCKAYSKDKMVNGIEVNFKGGQVGSENYFGLLLNGGSE